MHPTLRLALGCLLVVGLYAPPSAAEEGRARPNFALRDADGVVRRLSDYQGKWVVLEWINFNCAPVNEHYQAPARTMQTLQNAFKAKGVVWLTIHSAAVGQSGYLGPQQSKAALARWGARPTALLFDTAGTAGKAFGAQVTPEVRVVSPRGDVVYAGGVESAGPGARVPYLQTVLNAALSGRAIPYAAQSAQGCRITYATSAPSTNGPQAQNFTLVDTNGKTHRLSDYRGKWVILEWVNYQCPYVQKHYHASHRSMQTLQARSARHGIVWLSICSSARGREGDLTPGQANAHMRRMGARPLAYLYDKTGAVGRAYGAKTTPDMRIISPQGTIEYAGGIDSIRGVMAAEVSRAKNYVALAIADIVARRPIAIKSSRPYGCSVKY